MINLERDIEPFLDKKVCYAYWDCPSDHADFRAIIKAIDDGRNQFLNVIGVLTELFKAGYVIRRVKRD